MRTLLAIFLVAQNAASIIPTWKDLETWNRYLESSAETEVGLGLQPGGPTGSAALSFTARFPGKSVRIPAKEIIVGTALGPNFNSTVIRAPQLTFLLDEGRPKWTVMDFTPRFIGDELIPTRNLTSGVARITPDEYLRLTRVRALKANLLGVEVSFTRQQLDAMRAFARRAIGTPVTRSLQ